MVFAGKHRFACLPYVDGVTEGLQRVLTGHGIKACVKPFRTIRQSLASPKDPVANEKQTGLVYTIPCGGGGGVGGFTSLTLSDC